MGAACRKVVAAVWVAILLPVLGCSGSDSQPPAREPLDLTRALAAVKGTYAWQADLNRYLYSDKPKLEEILSARNRDAVLPILVDCLSDASASQSMIDGKPVAVGIVCYEALTQLIYYEPTAANGDVTAAWSGHMTPQASPDEMRAASEAWKKVVASKSFIFL